MKKLYYLIFISFLISSCDSNDDNNVTSTSITDIDNNTYDIVTIGSQIWMAENLDVAHYRNGDPIPHVTDDAEWAALMDSHTGAWRYYEHYTANGAVYGKLYNWYAVRDPRGLAPQGWHIPSKNEFSQLVNFLGGVNIAGDKLKESGNIHWLAANSGNNSSGFKGLGGGWSYGTGEFEYIKEFGRWWSNTLADDSLLANNPDAYYFQLEAIESEANYGNINPRYGFSVRCVKD